MTRSAATPRSGRVVRVNGPLVEVEALDNLSMSEIVDLGEHRLPAEVVSIRGSVATAQAYEYTGGLGPGDRVLARGVPLSAPLGPGLLGGIFDGLLRPLSGAETWLSPRALDGRRDDRTWAFVPSGSRGDVVEEGAVFGTVTDAGSIPHRVLVPPGVSGVLEDIAGPGPSTADSVVATVAGHEIRLTSLWPLRRPRPIRERVQSSAPLHTGQRAVDLLMPLARGSSAAVPGGFGTGKTMLLQQIAKWCDADVIVYVGCGERGNELADTVEELARLEDPRTGGLLSQRTVVIANTSNMPMMAREASIYTGMTVAEYYRDMGYHCVVIADSTSRWAEALREFASRTGALPAEEGYPADLASSLAAFYERAGAVATLGGLTGSVTVIGAVSPQGGDLTEPVTAHTQRFVRCLWTLDRDLAYARHYPAVSWSGSFSRDVGVLGTWYAAHGDAAWSRRHARVAGILAEADRLQTLAELVGATALPGRERMVMLTGRLLREGVLQQSALSPNDAYCSARKGAALVDAILAVTARCDELVDGGTPASAIEELDFTPIVRAREDAGPDEVEPIWAARELLLTRLEASA